VKNAALILACSVMLCLSVSQARATGEKWRGVDDTVVGKYATEHGRPAKPNLIELEGDALLFAFLLAGTVGGFALGYYYRDFIAKKDGKGSNDAV